MNTRAQAATIATDLRKLAREIRLLRNRWNENETNEPAHAAAKEAEAILLDAAKATDPRQPA